VDSTSRSSGIQSFKCGGLGHISKECPNNQVIIVNDDGKYELASEERIEEEAHGDEDLTCCEFEQGATLEMTQILSVQANEAENVQQHKLFLTRAKMHDKEVKVIIDGGSCHNLASHDMGDKLGLKLL